MDILEEGLAAPHPNPAASHDFWPSLIRQPANYNYSTLSISAIQSTETQLQILFYISMNQQKYSKPTANTLLQYLYHPESTSLKQM